MTRLRCDDLSMVFGGRLVLDRVSAAFEPGTSTALLGAVGAGRSALLRCLDGQAAPAAGRVTVEGIGDLADPRVRRRHRRATRAVRCGRRDDGRATALDAVLSGRARTASPWHALRAPRRDDEALARRCLERVGLASRTEAALGRLSDGERLRVRVARALFGRPRVVVGDEPDARVDREEARAVLSRLRAIAAEDGLTVVLSLRDAALSDAVGDQALYLADGRLRDARSATAAGRRQSLSARTSVSASSSGSVCSA